MITVDARPDKEEVQQVIRDRLGLPPYHPPQQQGARRPLTPMRVLVAPDSFKGTIGAAEAAAALARGVARGPAR